jgi:hypothetical protein
MLASASRDSHVPPGILQYKATPENTFLTMSGKESHTYQQAGGDKPEDERCDESLVALMKMKPKRHDDMKVGKP